MIRFLVPFDLRRLPVLDAEILIVGSGAAALRAALEASLARRVLVVTKNRRQESNSYHAQGGVAAAVGDHDSAESHIADTLRVGCGLSDRGMVEIVVREGAELVRELIRWGAPFDRADGRIAFGREGGHSLARVLHYRGDRTGAMIETTLLRRAAKARNLRILENTFAVDLVTFRGACHGALVWTPAEGLRWARARATILATGGAGQLYRETTNPGVATGDGMAMAYRAGAELMDMELMQFHPTTLYLAGAARALITEAVRGAGGILCDRKGRPFMKKYHPMAELAPRDVVSRAILDHMLKTRDTQVYLDVRHLKTVRRLFPKLAELADQYQLNLAKDLIPVRPSAHYMIGGVRIDAFGRTSVRNLFACGECATSGFHGANRLASNSLLECLVFGRRAGAAAAAEAMLPVPKFSASERGRVRAGVELDLDDLRNALRSILWRNVGIERDAAGLQYALDSIDFWSGYVLDRTFDTPEGWELQNMLLLGGLMADSALRRRESRGVHSRRDFPRTDDRRWLRHIVVRRESAPRLVANAE
ncbi:MAG: L-aspartate oxidase [Planctomycetes bacterium]|nr:L-aspartate oxidase [Planctomycetota bacterium]